MKMSVESQRMFYYWNLFPFEDCCRWFSYRNGYILSLREFAFGTGDKSFLRYLSFQSALDFKLNARRFCPLRIDIGSVYNISPPLAVIGQTRKSSNFCVTQREMIFDIDISDYSEVRNCCSESEICRKCWKYMALACKILDTALREDYAFKHILWTYSGNRGIHCWVCDETARKLTIKERKSVTDYLKVVKPGAFNLKKVSFKERLHPSIKRALRIIKQDFVQVCIEEQNVLGTEEGIEKFLDTFLSIKDSDTKQELRTIFRECETSPERWEAFKKFLKERKKWQENFEIEEVMLQYVYPRLDDNVTTVLTHLLRCPFSPHSGTKKICIPFDPAKVDDFDPTTSPNFPALFEESQLENSGTRDNLENLRKFRESLRVFNEFVNNLEKYKLYS